MSAELVNYSLDDGVATIVIDDGKRNALAPELLRQIYAALDRAETDDAIVILTGADDVFSAGFDLNVMKRGGTRAIGMLRSGYALTARVLKYPRPVIAACNGHVLAMGVFLMLSADYVVGTRGNYRVAANEVALGMTMPRVAAAMLRHRLAPAAYQRAVTLSEDFTVESALKAGFFDELVAPGQHLVRAGELAEQFKALHARAHRVSKRRIRRRLARKIRWSIPLDLLDAVMLALRGGKPK